MDPKKISGMVEWLKPAIIKALRGFLGLTNYYQKFITSYGKIVAHLTDMLCKNSFSWTKESKDAFESLKQSMIQALVLALPNFHLLFVVECDGIWKWARVILMQEQRPIVYFSIALKGKSLLLSIYEKELMALVLAVKKWRPYLLE